MFWWPDNFCIYTPVSALMAGRGGEANGSLKHKIIKDVMVMSALFAFT